MHQHQADASALKTRSQPPPHYLGFAVCGGRGLFAIAQALQELSQVSLFSTTKAQAGSRAPAPESRD